MCGDCEKSLPNQIVFDKIESIIRQMQDDQHGLPVKTAKSFMSKIPSVFTGTDLIQWMMRNMKLEDQQEAIHLTNLIASHGYIFPIEEHTLSIKNDATFYRFQTPCLWPSKNNEPENTDYAVYLCKRTMQGKTRLELADYEAENLARLQKMFSRKWEFIFMQAESQAKVDKKRDKLERKVLDSQERAFWDLYRPVPGSVNTTELDIKKVCRLSKAANRCGECQKVRGIGTSGQQASCSSIDSSTQATDRSELAEQSDIKTTSADSTDTNTSLTKSPIPSKGELEASDTNIASTEAGKSVSYLGDSIDPDGSRRNESSSRATSSSPKQEPEVSATESATDETSSQSKHHHHHAKHHHHHHHHHHHPHHGHHHHHHHVHHHHKSHCPRHRQQEQKQLSASAELELASISPIEPFNEKSTRSSTKMSNSGSIRSQVSNIGEERPASACCATSGSEKRTERLRTAQSIGQHQSKMQPLVSIRRNSSLDIRPSDQDVSLVTSASGRHENEICNLERELESLRLRVGGVKMSKVTQSYLSYFEQWAEYDPFIAQPIPSNPWISDSTEFWDSERQTKDVHCRRVRRWAFSLKELLNDPAGREQFYRFLEKEFSAENLNFWDAVQDLKRVRYKDVARRVEAIWTEYLAQDANCPINIDSKSYETSKKNMAKNKNNRYIFDEAAGHVYQLMKNDSYPRYLRSEMYKEYKEASEKRRPNQAAFDVFKPQVLKHKFNL